MYVYKLIRESEGIGGGWGKEERAGEEGGCEIEEGVSVG